MLNKDSISGLLNFEVDLLGYPVLYNGWKTIKNKMYL